MFHVKYKKNCLKMQLSKETDTFYKIQKQASKYFGMPENTIFLADKEVEGAIYMKDMKVKEALFPLVTAHRSNHVPEIYVILQSQIELIDLIDGGRRQKEQ